MRYRSREWGINEVIGTILMVVLLIALAVIIGGIVMGYIVIQPKSAYIPPRIEVVDYAGSQAISLYSRGGDAAVLDPAQEGRYVLGIYLDTPRGTFSVVPDSGVTTWNPGETRYIYYNATLNEYRAGGTVPDYGADPIPDAEILLRVVDLRAQLLVLKEGIAVYGGGTPVTIPTPTATPPPACGTISGRVYNITDNTGLSGITVQYRYRKDQGGSPYTNWMAVTTGAGGNFMITDVPFQPAYFYEVGVVVPPGWSFPGGNYTFKLNPGAQCYKDQVNFGLQEN